ncbi:MAG: MG2 domain-containing protein [Candidatus Cryptobacteroides sp.]|nr:MG2 domain-containing protein [Candidatus Cryptobacteroides sp.]
MKRNIISHLAAAFACICGIIVTGCGGSDKVDSGFSAYVDAFTGGIVSGNADIIVELTAPAAGISGTGEEISDRLTSLFSFSPSLKGRARLVTPERIAFTPVPGSLKPGKSYSCDFKLSEVMETDKPHSVFRFSFRAARKQASLSTGNIIIRSGDASKASVTGRLTFSEAIEAENPAALIEVKYEGGAEVEAEFGDNSESVYFTISGLDRPASGEKDKTLRIKFVPGNTGFEACQDAEVSIPARNGFRIIGERAGDNSGVDIVFSEPLDPRQNLRGLVNSGNEYYKEAAEARISDNILSVFPEDARNIIYLEPGIAANDGNRLAESWKTTAKVATDLPEVWFPYDGSILPDKDAAHLTFRAQNLRAVDVRVIKIFPSNILMYLQDNDIDGNDNLRRAGRVIYRSTVNLDSEGGDLRTASDYSLDLSGLIEKDPEAIYRIRLSFNENYYIHSEIRANTSNGLVKTAGAGITEEDEEEWDIASTYYYDNEYDWSKYDWRDRNDPTKPTYYMEYRYPERSIMASGLGVIAKYSGAKAGNGTLLWVAVSDLNTAEPVSGAEITVYSFQLQQVGKGKSASGGLCEVECSGRPFAIKVKKGDSVTWLKVNDGNEKSLSRFDTGGEVLQKGLKGFVYGDRGVWRPGDTLNLSLMVNGLPEGHPASMTVYSPEGQYFTKRISNGLNGLYVFSFATGQDSPTGIWNAYFKVGGATFHKSLHIEAIKPNRLKINADISGEILQGGYTADASISSNWLTGPAASGLTANMEMTLTRDNAPFKGFEDYIFADRGKEFSSTRTNIWTTRLDGAGKSSSRIQLPAVSDAPGMLKATIVTSVNEEGGDQSISVMTRKFSPFNGYVGVKLPSDYIETGKDNTISVAVLDAGGRRKSGQTIEWRIFKLDWSWWWESRKEPLDSYINGSNAKAVSSGKTTSTSGDISIPVNIDDSQWGRYLIYVRNLSSGHCTGGFFFADWPAYRGRADRKDPNAPTMLSFSMDKKSYRTGETATVFIPAAENGMALVSVENGRGVLKSSWVKTSATGDTPWTLKVTDDMAPNFYVHVTLVEPYAKAGEGNPVRMYGVMPAMVEAPESHIEPVITMPDKLHPEEPFTVKISEKKGRPMTYTLAIVDEGLLDITGFRTPDPWTAMNKREALGVRTWDMYDEILKGGAGMMSSMFSIGGDEDLICGVRKENRFNPVVKFLGPFSLKSGSDSHKIRLPMYVGSVRVMVVAGQGGAYGNADKTLPVTSPVMVVPTLPRIASCGESITLPVNVFVMEDGISSVKITVKCEGALSPAGEATESLSFSGTGDKMARFSLKAAETAGAARVTVTAEGGSHRISETVNMEVRNPAPHLIDGRSCVLAAGEKMDFNFTPFRETAEDKVWVEAGGTPSVDWNRMFKYMRYYPHSCSEQICSKGLTLLYALQNLSEENYGKAREMIPQMIDDLYSRQRSDGGISYWPGTGKSNEWVSSMALEFLAAARAEGFQVAGDVVNALVKYQRNCVNAYKRSTGYALDDLAQAYRLFSLAVSGNADEASMNRLKLGGELSWPATMMLASAYSACGKAAVGKEIIDAFGDNSKEWTPSDMTFGSSLRDNAIMLEALVRTGDISAAVSHAAEIIRNYDAAYWNTQESFFIAKAFRELSAKVTKDKIKADASNSKSKSERNGVITWNIDSSAGMTSVTNNSAGPVFVRFTAVSQPSPDTAVKEASNGGLELNVRYTSLEDITVDPAEMVQGDEFTAVITVANCSATGNFSNLALTYLIPSGWEIINDRLTGTEENDGRYDRLDIRDDRVLLYFDLPMNTYKKFRIRLRAAYEGDYILPSASCECMYDRSVNACTASERCKVTRLGE